MRVAVALLAFLAISCNQSIGPVRTTPNTALIACRLPITIEQSNTPAQGAFIDLPSGAVTIDHAGKDGWYYDRPFSKWVPVSRSSVSPDGSHYVHQGGPIDGKPTLNLVDVAGGPITSYLLPVELNSGIGSIDVFDYSTDTVYMGLFGEGNISGLWALNLVTRVTQRVGDLPGISVVDHGIVWLNSFNTSDPNPLRFAPRALANQIEKLDLTSGTRSTWLYRPGNLVGVVGIDAERRPIVLNYLDKDTVELSVLLDATSQRSIYKGTKGWPASLDTVGGGVVADGHGVWFGTAEGVYLYTESGGVKRVSNMWSRPAGACV